MIYPINEDKPIVYAHNGLTAKTPAVRVVACRQMPTEEETNRLFEEIVAAAGFIKLETGVVNNAAWAACLDAYELLKPLKNRFNRNVKGGGTAGDGYKRCFKALKDYQRNLLYTQNNRFFHVADMTDDARSFYSENMTDEEYYDFWASFGFKAYDANKAFLTCLVNKLKLVYEHGGIKDAEAAAWSMGAYMTLSIATESYSFTVKETARRLERPISGWQSLFRGFDLSHVEKLWGAAHKDMFPELAKLEFTELEYQNIRISVNQWGDRLLRGKTLEESRMATVADFADDIFRTKGCAREVMRGLAESELIKIE